LGGGGGGGGDAAGGGLGVGGAGDAPGGADAERDFAAAAARGRKRLRALQKDITACRDAGGTPQVTRSERGGDVTVQIVLEHLKSRRTTRLDEAEFDLLKGLPGMTGILASN